MNFTAKIFSILFILAFAGITTTHAADYVPLVDLPGVTTAGTEVSMSSYLSNAIKLIIAVGAALSVLIMIIGGTQYVASGIAPSAKEDAKNRITNALIGLILIITSYLILNSINPKLVAFELMLPPVGSTPTPPPTNCPFTDLEPLTGVAASMEPPSGATVIFSSNDSSVQINLTALQTEIGKLNAALGQSVTPNSAYRPMAYQRHLYDIVDKWVNRGLKDNTDSVCASIKATIGAEYSKHELGTVVASPNACAPHTVGKAVDLHITGSGSTATVGGHLLSDINNFMVSKNVGLIWKDLPNDPVHFELRNPPYTGCAASH